ncbi:hypothetical protein CKO12_11595 [Chromatium okenii]|uniref:hypothetical protein n=1 Tax=Chromatium okenii TaxID=61644 RepID=UPI001907316C|nr:hypothetical protein [Chromatium okenii]MBK1642510.1 hypothetical protein [Chromatium okenii]
MARLLLTSEDNAKTVPLTGTLFWDVVGSARVDLFEVQAGTAASILGGAGKDLFRLLGNQTDYSVYQASSNVVFTHQSTGETVTIKSLSATGDEIAFVDTAPISLKITGGALMLGEQLLTPTPSPITTSTDTADSNFSLDGKGTAVVPVEIDASESAFVFTDLVSTSNNVSLLNFTADDEIIIFGATASDYDDGVIGTNEAGDIAITYNQAGILNQITLLGAVTDTSLVFDVTSFNALPIGNLVFG